MVIFFVLTRGCIHDHITYTHTHTHTHNHIHKVLYKANYAETVRLRMQGRRGSLTSGFCNVTMTFQLQETNYAQNHYSTSEKRVTLQMKTDFG